MSEEKRCVECGITTSEVRLLDPKAKLSYCGECLKIDRRVVYCSRSCQSQARRSHRPTCGKVLPPPTSSSSSGPSLDNLGAPTSPELSLETKLLRFLAATGALWAIRDPSGFLIGISHTGTEYHPPLVAHECRSAVFSTRTPASVARFLLFMAPCVELLIQTEQLLVADGSFFQQMEEIFAMTRQKIVEELPRLANTNVLPMDQPRDAAYALVSQLGGSYSSSSTGQSVFIPSPALARQCAALAADYEGTTSYFIFASDSSDSPVSIPDASTSGRDEPGIRVSACLFACLCLPTSPERLVEFMQAIAVVIIARLSLCGKLKIQVDKLCATPDWTPEESTEVVDVRRYCAAIMACVMLQLANEFGQTVVREAMRFVPMAV